MTAQERQLLGQNIYEPYSWNEDGGARIESVVDPNWLIDGKPRVIRRMGWRNCMCCKGRMFSRDLHRVRICDTCKSAVTGPSERQAMPRGDRHWSKRRATIHPGQDSGGGIGVSHPDFARTAPVASQS